MGQSSSAERLIGAPQVEVIHTRLLPTGAVQVAAATMLPEEDVEVGERHVDAVLVPDPADPHTELADRLLEVFDEFGWIESVV